MKWQEKKRKRTTGLASGEVQHGQLEGHTAMTPGKQVTRPLEPPQAQVPSNLLVGVADAFLHLHSKVSISSCWFISSWGVILSTIYIFKALFSHNFKNRHQIDSIIPKVCISVIHFSSMSVEETYKYTQTHNYTIHMPQNVINTHFYHAVFLSAKIIARKPNFKHDLKKWSSK